MVMVVVVFFCMFKLIIFISVWLSIFFCEKMIMMMMMMECFFFFVNEFLVFVNKFLIFVLVIVNDMLELV